MESPITAAPALRAEYEEKLLLSLAELFTSSHSGAPWVAVALAYHHGLSFGPVLGVLPHDEYEAFKSSGEDVRTIFNPAEWSHYDDSPFFLDEAVTALARELQTLADSESVEGVPRFGREIHVRVASALRKELVEAGCLLPDGLLYAAEFCQSDFLANLAAANPPSALAAHGIEV